MPYINPDERDALSTIGIYKGMSPGELNYLITSVITEFWRVNGKRYQQINDILGALEGAKLEFYRRIAAPYEDKKILENGDVYD